MTNAEIKSKFDEIVAFSEIEKFLDTPVKRYSSGMYVRLAFAVAAHLEPEILIIDEVLAVGDAQFQKKCLGKMGEVAKGGRTVLFVSPLSKLSQFCDYANKSKLMQKGTDRNLYKTRFNDLFWLNKTGYVDQCIINSGVFEEHSTRIARRLIKEGDTVLDVGANIGYYSVMFSKLVGETGKVFAFEPTKFFGTVLSRNHYPFCIVYIQFIYNPYPLACNLSHRPDYGRGQDASCVKD